MIIINRHIQLIIIQTDASFLRMLLVYKKTLWRILSCDWLCPAVVGSDCIQPFRVNFRKDFWDCRRFREKNWPIADRRVPSAIPETIAARISVPVLNSSLKRCMRDKKENHFTRGGCHLWFGFTFWSNFGYSQKMFDNCSLNLWNEIMNFAVVIVI